MSLHALSATTLPGAPAQVVAAGEPLHGRYEGRVDEIDWSTLGGAHRRSMWWRRFHHKRWQYVGIGSHDVYVGVALVDLGWCMSAFAYVFDRQRKRVVADWAQDGLPGLSGGVSNRPVQGADAWFKGPGAALSLSHEPGDLMTLHVHTPVMALEVEMALGQGAPFLLAVGPIEGGVAHATQKSGALPVSGWVEVDERRRDLGRAVACLDSSNGLLARDTAWRWACAHQADIGFNLQQGYFGQHENALWLHDELIPLGAAHFAYDAAEPLGPWRIHTDDGLLDLTFMPEGARRDDRDLLFAASRYVQPVGTFHGVVRASPHGPALQVNDLLGVTEDHQSRW